MITKQNLLIFNYKKPVNLLGRYKININEKLIFVILIKFIQINQQVINRLLIKKDNINKNQI